MSIRKQRHLNRIQHYIILYHQKFPVLIEVETTYILYREHMRIK